MFLRRRLILLTLVAVFAARHDIAIGEEPAPATPTAASAGTADNAAVLSILLGQGRRLRDFAPFITERGEPAFLVLFVTAPFGEPPPDATLTEPLSCPEMVEGIALGGTYHVALVISGRLVNEVQIPGTQDSPDSPRSTLDFPLRNTPFSNYWDWGQGTGSSENVVEPTKLVKLADYNGDGHAWEFRLVQTEGACGGVDTLLAGYSATQRRAILFPIIMGKDLMYWYTDFFPFPVQPDANTIHYKTYPCQFGDATELQRDQRFEYNNLLEGWVLTGEEDHLCAVGAEPASPTNVQVHIGSAHGHPGEIVSLAVTVGPGGHAVDGIELHLPLGNGLEVMGCTVGHASQLSNVKTSDSGIDVILSAMSCPAPLSPHGCTGLPDSTTLLTCEVAVSGDADAGAHEIAPTGVLVSNGRDRLPTTVTKGEIVVEVGAMSTPSP